MKLKIPRGTTYKAVIILSGYEYQNGDVMRFGVKAEDLSGSLLISKQLSYDSGTGGFLLELAPADTAGLNFGTYLYDIGLQTADDDYFIPVECDEFIVGRTVTQIETGE